MAVEAEKLTQRQVAQEVEREIARQDARYGPFDSSRGSVRLAVACMEDEVREARDAWRQWRRRPDWYSVREEAIQAAAVASRLARDVLVELVD